MTCITITNTKTQLERPHVMPPFLYGGTHLNIAAQIVMFYSKHGIEMCFKLANWDTLVDMEMRLAGEMARLIYYAPKIHI